MKFLLDVHIAASIGRALREQGHDVVRASDAHGERSDLDLLDIAVREQRILVTEDRDFSDLIYRDGAPSPPAVLYLRSNATAQPELVDRILLILANTDIDGHMVVIQRAGVRHRPLPEKSIDNG